MELCSNMYNEKANKNPKQSHVKKIKNSYLTISKKKTTLSHLQQTYSFVKILKQVFDKRKTALKH